MIRLGCPVPSQEFQEIHATGFSARHHAAGAVISSHAARAWAAYIRAGPPPIWMHIAMTELRSSRVAPARIRASTWKFTQGSQSWVMAMASATYSRYFTESVPSSLGGVCQRRRWGALIWIIQIQITEYD